jgi:hypothetical protein
MEGGDRGLARSEARTRAKDYLKGWLSQAEHKNRWQLAEVTSDIMPYCL